ncbi:hypothetical protein C7T94_09800 [Pedobacter yulinensis]|uniref:DUF3857 domain-containing protein n=1 Tax=Pedobacter yulinensis TaxID=2126353 RepID=A0A2T3HKE6_9SPHI|nr:DUF3857 domain-containing protein [Pedobacter yulinensis]PST82917.1 hypothetical protein C7T94_09800 [Pedobacter yulinensis]
MKTLSFGTARLFLKSSLFLLFLYILAGSVNAQKQVYIERAAPGWVTSIRHLAAKPAAGQIEDGWYYSIYEKQDHAELKAHYTRCVREISSEAGVQNGSQLRISFDPGYQRLVFHKLVIRRGNREIDQLKASAFRVIQDEQELSRFIYKGEHTAIRILEDVRKGDLIDYSFSIVGDNPVFAGHVDEWMYFEGESVIANIYYSLLADSRRKINIRSFHATPALHKEQLGTLNRYSWQTSMTRTHQTEDNEPSWFNPYARVQLSDYRSWADVVNWALALNGPDAVHTPALKRKIEELKETAAGDRNRYLQLATRFVQDEVRYMGMEMGEFSHRPNRPEKVLLQRYGDCKDKSLLLVQLLKGVGVEAYPAYISTSKLLETRSCLPSPGVFDHVVVVVNHQGRKIWIDPTISQQRGAFSDTQFPYTANVLVIRPGNNRLERVNAVNKGKTVSTLTFNLNDTTNADPATLRVVTMYTGADADRFRAELAESNRAKIQENYEKYYREYYPGVQIRLPLEVDDTANDNKITTVELYDIKDFWAKREPGKIIPHAYIYSDLTSGRLPEIKNLKRKSPLAFAGISNHEQNIELYLPMSWPTIQAADSIAGNGYRFSVSVKGENDFFTVRYRFQTTKDALQRSNFAGYKADYKKITDLSNFYITWDGSKRLASFYGWHDESADTLSTPSYTNVIFIAALVCTMAFAALLLWIYRRPGGFNIEKIESARPIRGWLLLAGLGIVVNPIKIAAQIWRTGYFDAERWPELASNKGLVMLTAGELVFNLIMFIAGIYLAFAFFNRRDIFPRSIITYLCTTGVLYIADNLLADSLVGEHALAHTQSPNEAVLMVQVVVTILWVLYYINSYRVKETFVFPFDTYGWRMALLRRQMDRPLLPTQPPEPAEQKHEHEEV